MTYAFILCDLLNPDEIRAYSDEEASDTSDADDEDTEDEDDSLPLSHCQFYLLATYSDYVVSVFEGRHAGPSVELGELRNNFFEKSHIFKRSYDSLDEIDPSETGEQDRTEIKLDSGDWIDSDIDLSNPYSRPQENLFALFVSQERLYRWTYRADIAEQVQGLSNN